MAARARCYRHSPHIWIAACADCTAWHLTELATAEHPSAAALPPVSRRTPAHRRADRAA
jgi:hypothetical protein